MRACKHKQRGTKRCVVVACGEAFRLPSSGAACEVTTVVRLRRLVARAAPKMADWIDELQDVQQIVVR